MPRRGSDAFRPTCCFGLLLLVTILDGQTSSFLSVFEKLCYVWCALCKGKQKQYKSRRIDDDYSYYNDFELMRAGAAAGRRRGYGRRRTANATGHEPTQSRYVLLSAVIVVLLLSARPHG